MSVVYPADPEPEPPKPGILQEASMHPVLAVLVIILGALALGFLVSKLRGGSSSASTQSSGQPQVLYVPTSNTFANISETDGGGTDGAPAPPGPTFPISATVRDQIASSTYDKQYGGVAVFATPATNAGGGHNTGFVPFGSQIQLLSQATGTPYGGPGGGGSSTYYLTPQGYINSQDVVLSSSGSSGGAGGTGRGAYTPIEWPHLFHSNLMTHEAIMDGEHTPFMQGFHPRLMR